MCGAEAVMQHRWRGGISKGGWVVKKRKFPELNALIGDLDVKIVDLCEERAETARLQAFERAGGAGRPGLCVVAGDGGI